MSIRMTKDGREILSGDDYEARRREVWERDAQRCVRCYKPLSLDGCHIDHIKKRRSGGGFRNDRLEDLQTMCGICHWRKDMT
jgi:5-methylcytosine-specific restriction endonuclease McrA